VGEGIVLDKPRVGLRRVRGDRAEGVCGDDSYHKQSGNKKHKDDDGATFPLPILVCSVEEKAKIGHLLSFSEIQ